ncbi:hypothetical protein B7Z00_01150 [Candidatus Saccharibacteria bacterium 32-50-10]|nr:MAG: hypothetical protein B7Z00_01150 [Candidatus Saccharibacteria bacterium 32-50-10]
MVNKRRNGFTLVELSLVMAFFSILLMGILTVTLHIGKLYTKGMTNKSLNSIGRDVTDTLRRDFAAADATRISGTSTSSVLLEGSTNRQGRVCLGNVSYVWNTVGLLNGSDATTSVVTMGTSKVKLVRVVDTTKSYCVLTSGRYPATIPSTATASDLLSGGDTAYKRDYAIYNFSITPAAVVGDNGIYRVKFTIGTYDPNTTNTVGGVVECRPPTTAGSNFEYCSVADFDTFVRVGGEKQ